ncbi:MAG: hypothetical protein IK092_07010 [Muribaculaceae bacterium]|nr:hypothetical protein [Muribaculaceae bacterium]
MKPITNLLLVVAIVCYSLFTFYVFSMHDSTTGLGFTERLIAKDFSFSNVILALLPFISCFGAIVFNSLKSRYWGLLVVVFIALGIHFFASTGNFHAVEMPTNPGLSPSDSVGNAGLRVVALGAGHRIPHILLWVALVSALISILPFKFNKKLEQSIDNKLHNAKEQVSKLGHDHHSDHQKTEKEKEVQTAPEEKPNDLPEEEKNQTPPTDEERYAAYMPPQDDRDAAPLS